MKPHKKSLRLGIASDIKAGLTYEEVLQKYSVSRGLIRKLSEELAREELISEKEFDNFQNTDRKAVETKRAQKADDPTTIEDIIYQVLDSQHTKREAVDSSTHPISNTPEELRHRRQVSDGMTEDYQMFSPKEVIIVAPETYRGLARKLSHEISKIPCCNGAVWTIKDYEDNEFQLGGNRYVVLIGSSEENSVTKDFLSVINTLHSRAGAYFGYDGTKAVIFGEGKLEQMESFKKIREASGEMLKTEGADSTRADGYVAVRILPGMPEIKIKRWAVEVALDIVKNTDFGREVAETNLRGEQTKLALSLFLTQCFDEWIGLRK